MQEDHHLDPLRKVQKVAAPPFLFTRIEAKIQRQEEGKAPIRWVWVGATVFTLLLVLNVLSLTTYRAQDVISNDLEYVINDMGLNTSNQLYDE